jgi:hypothetical protein
VCNSKRETTPINGVGVPHDHGHRISNMNSHPLVSSRRRHCSRNGANNQDSWTRSIVSDVLKTRVQCADGDIDRYLKLLLAENKPSDDAFEAISKIEERRSTAILSSLCDRRSSQCGGKTGIACLASIFSWSQCTARCTCLPMRVNMLTSASMVNFSTLWFTTSETRGRVTRRTSAAAA